MYGRMLAPVAHILADVGPMLALLAPVAHILADVGPMLADILADVGPCWPYLGNMLAHATHILADGGLMLAQVCPYFGLMLTHLAHILADVGPMLATMPSRCQIFRSGPPPNTQNHEKPIVFKRRQDEIRGRRRPQNPVKNDVFWTPHAEYTVNHNDNRGSGVNQNWPEVVGGRGVHAYNLRLPPKASGKDTGCGPGPAPGLD